MRSLVMKAGVSRLARLLIVVPATAVLLGAATATAASAMEGKPSGPPPPVDNWSVNCVSTTGAKACFAEYGDRVWVKDTKANGADAAATLKDDEPDAQWYRECFNRRGAEGGWVMCNFNVPEYQRATLWAVNNPFVGNEARVSVWTGSM